MRNLSIIILLLSALFQKKLQVHERVSAFKIDKGYSVMHTDKTFKYGNATYLIKTIENFDDNGDLTHVTFWKPEGYLEFSKSEFSKIKYFIQDNGLSQRLDLEILDHKRIKVGNEITYYNSIDSKLHRIYYKDKANEKLLYQLSFQ